MLAQCKLCGNQAKLINAHIIPKSLYGELRDEKGNVSKLVANSKGVHPKRSPIGIYDSSIVCASCEALFSPWDDYANEFFSRTDPTPIEHNGKVIGYEYAEYDYSKLKLFFMSMLWRAHASTQPFFNRVKLGTFENNLKRHIKANDPGSPAEYSVVLAKFDHELGSVIADPYLGKIEGINCYRFYLSMYSAIIKVDRRQYSQELSDLMIKPDEPCRVIARDFAKSKELKLLKSIIAINKGKI